MLNYIVKRPMLICASLCVTICFVSFKSIYFLPLVFVLITIATVISFLKSKSFAPFMIILLVTLYVFSLLLEFNTIMKYRKFDSDVDEAVFTVTDITYKSDYYCFADIEIVESTYLRRGTKLSLYYKPNSFSMGDTVNSKIRLSNIEGEYLKDSYSKQIYLSAELLEYTVLEDKSDFILKTVGKLRNYIKTTLFNNLNFSEAATLCALLFGDRSYFTNDFYSNIKSSGVSHVMVVSGLHLTIFVTVFTYFINKRVYNRYLKALLQFLVVIFVSAMCGFTMSILRAGVTFILGSLSLIIGRENTSENTLGLAVVLILIFSPFAIFSVAFQLSILSTFGILSIALPISDFLESREIISNKHILTLICSLIITLSATLLTLPVTIYTFGFISTVAPLTNLLISYAVSLGIWYAIFGLIINLISPFIAKIIFIPCEYIVKYINYIINTLGEYDGAVLFLDKNWTYFSILLIFITFWLLLACKKRIDMLKLNKVREKIIKEGGAKLKWR